MATTLETLSAIHNSLDERYVWEWENFIEMCFSWIKLEGTSVFMGQFSNEPGNGRMVFDELGAIVSHS